MNKWVLFSVFWLSHRFILAQGPATLEIINKGSDTVRYCSGTQLLSPFISITGSDFAADDGIKISLIDFRKGEDTIIYSGPSKLKVSWNNNSGDLEITGAGSAAEYQQVVRNVYYKNLLPVPVKGTRNISITLKDADYLPKTGHFYKFYSRPGIYWTAAKDSAEADNKRYLGLKGYLVTITSKEENDFIFAKLSGIGWIGASDAEKEGEWKWVTGPEAGNKFYDQSTKTTMPGWVAFWNKDEPNNLTKAWGSTENYAHINWDPTTIKGSWNDLTNEGQMDDPTSYYYSQGYIVEYGGRTGDPTLRISVSIKLLINRITFSNEQDFELCSGTRKELNPGASSDFQYSWSPAQGLSATNVPSPLLIPVTSTNYKVVAKFGTSCSDSAVFRVKVNQSPVLGWKKETGVCTAGPYNLDAGTNSSYLWNDGSTGRTLTVTKEGWYSVLVTNSFHCATKDSTYVRWSQKPKASFRDTAVCGAVWKIANIAIDRPMANTWLSSLQPASAFVVGAETLYPELRVTDYGNYRFQLIMTDQVGCSYRDTLKMGFHHFPKADFQIDSTLCYGYNLKLTANSGSSVEPAMYKWLSNDTVYSSGIDKKQIEIPLGYGLRNRTVGLEINEQGCIDRRTEKIKVIPKFNFWADYNKGCSPLSVQFHSSSLEPGVNYSWDFGNGTTSGTDSPLVSFINNSSRDTSYKVTVTAVSSQGCKNQGSLPGGILIYTVPTADLDFDANRCYNDTVTVFYKGNGSAGDLYTWTIDVLSPDEIVTNPGNTKGPLRVFRHTKPTLNIGITVESRNGCKSKYFQKTLNFKPAFKVSVDSAGGCSSFRATFSVQPRMPNDLITYTWDFGTGTKITGDNPSYRFTGSGSYYDVKAIAYSSLTKCSDTVILPKFIRVFPTPVAGFVPKPGNVPVSDPEILFENSSTGASDYLWNFDDNSSFSVLKDPVHKFPDLGFFRVLLTAFNATGCRDTISHLVSVSFDRLFPPNAFSPNSPNEIDRVFRISSRGIVDDGYLLAIYSRWGERIFESISQATGWNGTMKNGNPAPAGNYLWVIRYLDFTGKEHKQQGTVTLLY